MNALIGRKPAASTWATLSDYQQGFFYMKYPIDCLAHTTAFVTPVVEHWLERSRTCYWIMVETVKFYTYTEMCGEKYHVTE